MKYVYIVLYMDDKKPRLEGVFIDEQSAKAYAATAKVSWPDTEYTVVKYPLLTTVKS